MQIFLCVTLIILMQELFLVINLWLRKFCICVLSEVVEMSSSASLTDNMKSLLLRRWSERWFDERGSVAGKRPFPPDASGDICQLPGEFIVYNSNNNNYNNNAEYSVYRAVIVTYSHCESSPGSCDECRTAPGGCRPLDQADQLESLIGT